MELAGIDQDKDGVTARIRKSASSGPPEEIEIRTSYLIGADGAKGNPSSQSPNWPSFTYLKYAGVTRKLMNLGFKGETKDSEGLIVGDVEIPDFDTEVSSFSLLVEVIIADILSSSKWWNLWLVGEGGEDEKKT